MPRVDPPPALRLVHGLQGLLGIAAGLLLARSLALVPSILLSALVLTAVAGLNRLPQDVGKWWGLIGLASGSLIGSGWVLAAALEQRHPAGDWPQRLMLVGVLALSGALCGRLLRNRGRLPEGRRPKELLRAASGLTTGVFAGIVAVTYIHSGLDVARTLSSRLSTALTILVIALVAPGWLSHQLVQRQGARP